MPPTRSSHQHTPQMRHGLPDVSQSNTDRENPHREDLRDFQGVSLSPSDLTKATYLAGRLFAELRSAIEVISSNSNSARSLAKTLGIDPNITQRITSAMQRAGDSITLLALLPGSPSLRRFFRAVGRKAGDSYKAEDGLNAVKSLDTFVRTHTTSRARFAAMVRASAPPPPAAFASGSSLGSTPDFKQAERARKKIFDSITDLTGLSIDLQATVSIMRQTDTDRSSVDLASLWASVGLQMASGSMPVLAGSKLFDTPEAAAQEQPKTTELGRDFTRPSPFQTLIQEFSSITPESLRIHREDRSILRFIEPPDAAPGAKFDVTLGERLAPLPSPIGASDPYITLGNRGRTPARMLIYTLFLHRDIAKHCRPSFGSYIWSNLAGIDPLRAWYDRFPSHGTFELLGQGIELAASPHWYRLHELVTFMFQKLDWDHREFVGYRLTVPYPCWGAVYNLLLDFSEATASREDLDTH